MPDRIQLSRAKGWRMPLNTVKVDRSTDWGNPFVARPTASANQWHCEGLGVQLGPFATKLEAIDEAIRRFEAYCPPDSMLALMMRRELRGKNLGCWCRIGTPCHGDVVLRLANSDAPE